MAGLLDYASSVVENVKNRVQGLLNDPRTTLDDIVNTLAAKAAAQQAATKAAWATRDPKIMAQNALDSSQTALGFAPLGITAWHGSPHKFDKFSLDKIGTGEGAQAYGHGLYLAESPQVAEGYKASTRRPEFLVNGNRWITDQGGVVRSPNGKTAATLPLDQYNAILGLSGSKTNKPLTELAEEAESFLQTRQGMTPAKIKAAKQAILSGKVKLDAETGALYKTDIPDEAVARFLDWDKPLSQQAPEVQKSIQPILDQWKSRIDSGQVTDDLYNDALNKTILGKDLYTAAGATSPKATSALKQNGILGIKYLDGGSRGAGQGSSNFVVFDPEMIRILERNGQATGAVPWQPGEWRGLLGK